MRDIIIHRSPSRRAVAGSAAALLAFLASACAGSSGASGGTESVEVVRRAPAVYRTYEVTGSTANEIARSLRENAPRAEGRRPAGLTTWDIRWNARWTGTGAMCRVTELDVPLRVEVLMPHWERPTGASDELARDWDTFVAALSRHEAGHVDLASEAAREVRRVLSGVTAPTCASMESRVRAEGDRVLRDYGQRQQWYDERTDRGATQGVVWPPRRSGTGRSGPPG
jgi:predicted secreted Zn-dependent protease